MNQGSSCPGKRARDWYLRLFVKEVTEQLLSGMEIKLTLATLPLDQGFSNSEILHTPLKWYMNFYNSLPLNETLKVFHFN